MPRETADLWDDEKVLVQLDNAIIAIMDIIRDETNMDTDSDDDDYLWGVVYGYVHGALRDAYTRRLAILKEKGT